MKRFLTILIALTMATACGSPQRQAEAERPVETEQAPPEAAPGAVDIVADVMTEESQAAMTPDQALQLLVEGNERFARGEMLNRDLPEQVEQTADGQHPFAVVLGCVDSRVPPELVFDQGIGDIFSARVAGNFVTDEMLGSMEFATRVAGSRLVVVLGHTSCGAVKGSCENVQLGHISSLVEAIRPSVEAVTPEGQTCSAENIELVNDIAAHNVERTIAELRQRSDIMAELERQGEIRIVGAMYDISTGRVTFMD